MPNLLTAAHLAVIHLSGTDVLAAPPDPGQGTQPPGKVASGVTTMLGWAAWVVFAICVLGILVVAGMMAIAHRRGEGGQHAAGLGWVLGATAVAGSASAIVGAVLV